ncbi:MAG: AAA family ATPase [Saccharothrix sp.]|nr:AAA family ATPase [Saccharothrix sp.]
MPLRVLTHRRALVAAYALQKGGVGKTTSTCNTARAASRKKLRTLVVDMDPQGNTTSTLSRDELEDDDQGLADVLVPGSDVAVRDVIVPTIWEGVDLLPAMTVPMVEAEDRINAARHGREHRLVEALDPLLDDYDLVLIDCPPSLGMLTINALAAADRVIVVAEADQWSSDGLALLRTTVDGVRQYSNPLLHWSGVLINKWRGTTDEQRQVNEIGEHFPEARVWPYRVPLWIGIKTNLNAGLGLDQAADTKLRMLPESTYELVVDQLMAYRDQAAA